MYNSVRLGLGLPLALFFLYGILDEYIDIYRW